MLRSNSRQGGDFILDNGAQVELKLGKDVLGNSVISRIDIYFPAGKPIPQGGVTAKNLREIDLTGFFSTKMREEPKFEISPATRRKLIKFVTKERSSTGRTGLPIEFYACLGYLYVEQFTKSPNDPTQQLADILKVSKRTLVNRLAMARKLGVLTPQSDEGRSGRAGGSLTMKGQLLVVALFGEN